MKTVCSFSSDNLQLLNIAAQVKKAVASSRDVAETVITELAPHAHELAAAYREQVTAIRSAAGANRWLGDLYQRELDALLALTEERDFQKAHCLLMAVQARLPSPAHRDPRSA